MNDRQCASLFAYIAANVGIKPGHGHWILRVGADEPERLVNNTTKFRTEKIVRHPSDPDRFDLHRQKGGEGMTNIREIIMWPDLIQTMVFQWIERRRDNAAYDTKLNRGKFKADMVKQFVVRPEDIGPIIKCFEEFVKQQKITQVYPIPFTQARRSSLAFQPSSSASAIKTSSTNPTSSTSSLIATSPTIAGPSAITPSHPVTFPPSNALPFSEERPLDQRRPISHQSTASPHASRILSARAQSHHDLQTIIAQHETNGRFMNMLLQNQNILGPSKSSYNAESFKFPPLAEITPFQTILISNNVFPLILTDRYVRACVSPVTATLLDYIDQLIRIARLRRDEHSSVEGMHRDLVEHLPHVLISLEAIWRDGHGARLLELVDEVINHVSLVSANKLVVMVLFTNIIRMIYEGDIKRQMWGKMYNFLATGKLQGISEWDAVELVGLGMFLAESDAADSAENALLGRMSDAERVQQFVAMVAEMRCRKPVSFMATMLWPAVRTFATGTKHLLHLVDGGDEMVTVSFPNAALNSEKTYLWEKVDNMIEMTVEGVEMQAGWEGPRGFLHIWTAGDGFRKWWKVVDDEGLQWFCMHHNWLMADALERRDACATLFRRDG
jgi:hypothetical protein